MLTVHVKSADPQNAQARQALADRVIAQFNSNVFETSPRRLVRFLDDEDATELKAEIGATHRGFFAPIDEGSPLWPPFSHQLKTYRMPGDLPVADLQLVFDDLV